MKGIIVLSFEWPTPEDVPASLEAIDPPNLPHFAKEARVAVEDSAAAVIKFLDEG